MKISCEKEVENKKERIEDIEIDSSIIGKLSLLPLIKGCYRNSVDPPWYEPQQCTYPLASIYYACNADTDTSRRVADIIRSSAVEPHFQPPTRNPYSEEEARMRYLESKPVCYIVFGKPGLDTERLAESIATERNCIFISASRILREIEENEDVPQRKQNKLECGCDSKEDVVWDFIIDRLSKRDVAHRGYVLEGIPIIQSQAKLSETTVCNEEIVSTTALVPSKDAEPAESGEQMDQIYLLCVRTGEEEFVVPATPPPTSASYTSSETTESSTSSQSPSVVKSLCSMLSGKYVDSSSFGTSSTTTVKKSKISECKCSIVSNDSGKCLQCTVQYQIEDIFSKWNLKPVVIVNISCPDDEILMKYSTPDSESRSSVEDADKKSDSQLDVNDILYCKSIDKLFDNVEMRSTKSKYTPEKLACDLEIYSKYAVHFIEKIIINHNPQNVICIDGCYPIDHSFEIIKIRLQTLPLQIAITPEKMLHTANKSDDSASDSEIEMNEGEESENESFEDFDVDNVTFKQAFEEMKRSGILSDKFQWKLSRWKFFCPVELAKGRKIDGKRKLAVRFMNWIFFLSSREAMETFIENPRPYLVPPNPRACCRMAVIGPRYSGKTDLSYDLATKLDSIVVNVRRIIARLNQGIELMDIRSKLEKSNLTEYINLKTDEIVNSIAECIESLPEQNCGDFFRTRGWILDDISLDFEFCKKLVENDIYVDTVIILFESYPYTNLIKHWHKIQEEGFFATEIDESEEYNFEEFPQRFNMEFGDLSDYVKELEYFDNNRKLVASKLSTIGIEVIMCDIKLIHCLCDHVIYHISKDCQFTNESIEEEEDEGGYSAAEFSGTEMSLSDRKANQLGDCNEYCPIALINHNILWKGKESYRCLLDDRLYFMSSEPALKEFMADFPKLSLPFKKAIKKIPPLRIFIIGPEGSGKSTLANLISRELGLANVNFFQCLEDYMTRRLIDVNNLKAQLIPNMSEGESYVEDDIEEFELPKNPYDSNYSTDNETISNFFLNYKRFGAALPNIMAKEFILKMFKSQFDKCGVVIDSFPNCVEDCELIVEKLAIPDVVIALNCNLKDLKDRLMVNLLENWTIEQNKSKDEEEAKYSELIEEYYEKKDDWMRKELLKRYKDKRLSIPEYDNSSLNEASLSGSESFFLSDMGDLLDEISTDEEIELEETFYGLFPEPELFDDWETKEAAKERFSMRIEHSYDKYMKNLPSITNYLQRETIPIIELDTRPPTNNVFVKLLYLLAPYSRRNSSFLEKVEEIDNLTAESLLTTGYYFLSSFGRFCPVQVYNKNNPFQMFLPLATQNEIFTVLHRQFVYFLGGKEALAAFKDQPLKYLDQDAVIPMIPSIISVIGPPKCGKSTLSRRFASTYGLELITKDEAINYVVCNFPWTNLASSLRQKIQNGEVATPRQIAAVLKLFLSNCQCMTQGCIFDGFPSSIDEARAFASFAISPLVVIDLEASLEFTVECLESDEHFLLSSPTHYLEHEEWKIDAREYRSWLNDYSGNLLRVDATKSKAAVWSLADAGVRHRCAKFLYYVRCAGYEKVHDVEHLCLTPLEIQEGISHFKLYCPSCIYFDKEYVVADISRSRQGLVQFRDRFYWLCEKHSQTFASNPRKFLLLYAVIDVPPAYPQIITDEVDLQNNCWSCRLVNKGYCLVSYVDNLPSRKLIPGCTNLAVLHANHLYLFCSEDCRQRFARRFDRYASLRIHMPQTLEPLDTDKLPDLGFLEQRLAAVVVKAVNRVGQLRPKMPGLSGTASAVVFVAAYLKKYVSYGGEGDAGLALYYEGVMRRMLARCQLAMDTIRSMKKRVNPWSLYYEEPVKDSKLEDLAFTQGMGSQSNLDHITKATVKFRRTSITQVLIETDHSSGLMLVPVPDARFDYLCEYFKPASKVPAFLNVVDIAGLVKGAAEGQGLGNAFLSHISACDSIFHLCRAFEDDDVTHIEGDVNPVRDLEIISEELRLKDIEFLNSHLDKLEKLVVRGNDKKLKPEYETLLKVKQVLVDEKNHIRFADWSANDIEVLNKYLFLTSKPVIYLVNLSEKDYIRKKNKWLIKIKEWVDKNDPGAVLIPFSGVFENKLLDMDDAERAKYIEECKVPSALDKIIVQGYKALQLQYFFTAGPDEVKAWTIQKGAKAPQAAGKIHTDFEKGFIMAEVMKFDDFKNEGSESAVKAAGKYRQQGRNYVVEDGDIIFFKFNAGAGLKDPKKK